MTDEALLAHLCERETALMRNAGPAGAAEAEALLHPLAEEVGRSGRCYDRQALLQLLAASSPREAATLDTVALRRLSPELALLRYRSERDGVRTERSSLWQALQGDWRLRFHQGTPV